MRREKLYFSDVIGIVSNFYIIFFSFCRHEAIQNCLVSLELNKTVRIKFERKRIISKYSPVAVRYHYSSIQLVSVFFFLAFLACCSFFFSFFHCCSLIHMRSANVHTHFTTYNPYRLFPLATFIFDILSRFFFFFFLHRVLTRYRVPHSI